MSETMTDERLRGNHADCYQEVRRLREEVENVHSSMFIEPSPSCACKWCVAKRKNFAMEWPEEQPKIQALIDSERQLREEKEELLDYLTTLIIETGSLKSDTPIEVIREEAMKVVRKHGTGEIAKLRKVVEAAKNAEKRLRIFKFVVKVVEVVDMHPIRMALQYLEDALRDLDKEKP